MYLLIEKGLRGGISYIAKIYSKANKKYAKNYDPEKFIIYLDMNKFYGWAIRGYLPYRGFKWLKNVDNFDINSVSEQSAIRYILNVELKHHDKLHLLHNAYPLAPEKRRIIIKIADEYEIKVGGVMKLIPRLGNKTNFVVHYRNLQLHMSLGLKLTKIHRALRFKQTDWIKEYIDFNTKIKNCC